MPGYKALFGDEFPELMQAKAEAKAPKSIPFTIERTAYVKGYNQAIADVKALLDSKVEEKEYDEILQDM